MLCKQLRLAIGRAAKDPQVAPSDAVAGQLGDRPHDFALGLVEVADSGPRISPLITPNSTSSRTSCGLGAVSSHYVLE